MESTDVRNMKTAEVFCCAKCEFTTITQKGLTIHLRKMHQIVAHTRKPRRVQNRRPGIRLANCSMSAKSWGLPYVCVFCGFRTAERHVIKEHCEINQNTQTHVKSEITEEPRFYSDDKDAGEVRDQDASYTPRQWARQAHREEILNQSGLVLGFKTKPSPNEMIINHGLPSEANEDQAFYPIYEQSPDRFN